MPVYEFKTDDGELVDLSMSFKDHDRRVKNGQIKLSDGRTAKTYWGGMSSISTVPSNYPMVSSAAGVHPGQIKEHMDHLRSQGCGQVNHTKDGDIIFESKGQRKKVLETLGMFDRQGGYSDPQPKIRTASCRKYR